MEPDALPPELEVVAIREANRMLVERDAAHLARIAELEAEVEWLKNPTYNSIPPQRTGEVSINEKS